LGDTWSSTDSSPELNECSVTTLSFDDDKGRHSVELDDTSSSTLDDQSL
jgi:hypothetical protein